jgi:hypothetical protein
MDLDWLPLKISPHLKVNGRFDDRNWIVEIIFPDKVKFTRPSVLNCDEPEEQTIFMNNILEYGKDNKYSVDVYMDEADIPYYVRLDDPNNPSFWLQIPVEVK